jgi:hypothetical protein
VRDGDGPDWFLFVVGPVAAFGLIAKGFLLFMLLSDTMSADAHSSYGIAHRIGKRNAIRHYRWWGRGWLPVVAGAC